MRRRVRWTRACQKMKVSSHQKMFMTCSVYVEKTLWPEQRKKCLCPRVCVAVVVQVGRSAEAKKTNTKTTGTQRLAHEQARTRRYALHLSACETENSKPRFRSKQHRQRSELKGRSTPSALSLAYSLVAMQGPGGSGAEKKYSKLNV